MKSILRRTVTEYKTKLSTYSPEVTRELSILVDGAFEHLPDRGDMYVNQQYYDSVKQKIANYDLHHESIDLGTLNNALDKFLQQSKTFTIEGQVSAAPRTGDAPLSVTLEAKGMKDGSGTLIPDTNYIWWVRVPEGSKIIGRGKTINYIFQDEGTYTVNLTVNSASKNSKGFRDVINFEDSVTIEVGQPKVKFVVYFNDQLATDNVKLSSRESEQKVIIDASHTKFSSGYTIKKTEWDFGNGKTDTNDGRPLIRSQDYKEGEYIVKLKLTRNDDEVFTKNIVLKVGDPIASIFASKLQPDKGEKVTFQAKKVSQDGVSYAWEIRKIGSNSLLATATGPRMEYAFLDVGRYSVDLISSKRDIRDKESIEILIDSQVPVVRFDAQVESSETPNIYLFDGTASYDPDYPDDQTMKYEWFINDKPVQLIDTNSSNSRGSYIFPEKGTYQIELHVTDKEGKQGVFKKTITIKNLLAIQLNIRPQVVKRGDRILLSATAPNAETFEWNIAGKDQVVQETGKLITSFDKSGTYPLTIKVTDTNGDTNMLKRKIYVINGEEPLAIMNMTSKSLLSGYEQNACEGQEALIADRVSPVSFVGDKSVNSGGKTSDLTYFWKIGLNKTSTQKNLSHTFDELGCEKVTLTVQDKKTGVTHTTEEWIKVVNVPPKFSDIEVAVENIDMDPMKVNLRIQGAKDPDGIIRSYTWYYATNPDGDEPLGFRITTKPETSLVLQKLTGRYYFFVIMEDSNGMRVDTRASSEMRFSTPDLLINQNLAMPVIDFQASATEVPYGDEVTFDVTVEDVFKKNIADASEFRWDVDGDGFYDIKTTQPTFKYKYTTPGEYHPKVKVTHRGLSTTKSLNIKVVNRLIPQIDLQIIGEKIIAYNTSTGIFESVAWFADDKKISENKEYLYYDARDGTFPKTLKIQISDGKKTEEKIYNVVKNTQNKAIVEQIKNQLVVLTNSDGTLTEASDNIVWTDGAKPLFIYLGESQGEIKYYVIDTDVDIDTDLSGGKDDDADNK